MRIIIGSIALVGLVAAIGCGDDTTAAGGNGGTSSDGGGGNNPTTGGEGTGANGGNGTGGTGGQSPECPAAGGDTTCDTCAKDSCCAAYEACLADDSCATCFACTQAADDPTTCLGNECDVEQPEEAALISCAYESCRADCFGGQSICNPSPEQDTPCVTCAKAASDADPPGCCPELEACVVDEVCLRCLGCVVTAKDPVQECTSVCQFGNEATGGLLNCAAFPNGNCTPVCNP